MRATEIRNVLSIYDNDELNIACLAEKKEDLQDELIGQLCDVHGVSKLYGATLKFSLTQEVLENFGFKYLRSDEDAESHQFFNKDSGEEIKIYPLTWYPKQDAMRVFNFVFS